MDHFSPSSPDLQIENGVLRKYTGQASHVDVPDGVTAIGMYAFSESS